MPTGVLTLAATALLSLAGLGSGASLDEWRSRSIYQVMTDRFAPSVDIPFYLGSCHTELGVYCGGTWRGIKDNLDYIQGMNFDAIWISPIVAQLPQVTADGSSYAGYWQQDLFTLNSKYGTIDDLHELMDEVHKRGMLFMMDVIVNHMAYSGAVPDIEYSVLNPFNDKDYYHPYCEMDYSADNMTALQQCWLGSYYIPLVDLATDHDEVRDMFSDWISQMATNHSFDGLRIDAGANVDPDFFPGFMEAADMFATAEVYLSNETLACEWQETIPSLINYPLYWPLTAAFESKDGSMSDLVDMMSSQKKNHDVPRFANHTQDITRAMNVNAFVLMNDGIPIVYQGQEQHFTGGTEPFTNREVMWEYGFDFFAPLYQEIATLNTLRQHLFKLSGVNYGQKQTDVVHQDDHTMVMQKGEKGKQILTVLTNSGWDGDDESISFTTGYSSGDSLTDVLTCTTVSVGTGGTVKVTLSGGIPMVLFSTDDLADSTLCGTKGEKWGANTNITSTQTTRTTITTTMAGGSTSTSIAAATLPLVTQAQAYDAPSMSASASPSGLAGALPVNTMMAGSFAALAVVLTSGAVGAALGFGV